MGTGLHGTVKTEDAILEIEMYDRDDLLKVILELYHSIHDKIPHHMHAWDKDELIDWFLANYEFNELKQSWYCKHENARIH
jgi:hypothetical protein